MPSRLAATACSDVRRADGRGNGRGGVGAEEHVGEAHRGGELIPRAAGKRERGKLARLAAKVMGVNESVVDGA